MYKLVLAIFSLAISLNGFATEFVLNGTGIDNMPCQVHVVKDKTKLKSIEVFGASKNFNIINENGASYGPSTRVSPYGGEEIVKLIQKNPDNFLKMSRSESFFSDSETFTFDTSKIKSINDSLGGIKMIISIELSYDENGLAEVVVQSKAKALVIATLASSRFECKIN